MQDMVNAVHRINRYTVGKDLAGFSQNDLVADAVVRHLITIGEAAKNIPQAIRNWYPDVPWRDIGDFRDVLVHEYFRVSRPIIWDTITRDLPLLLERLQAILTQHS